MVFAYHQVTFVACHVIPAFLRVATALWSHSTLDKTTIWFWCRSLEAVDVKSYDCQGCASECTLLPLCCHLLLSTKLPLPIAATEGDNARKPNETIKIQKRETTLPTADRSFPLHLTEDSTRCPHHPMAGCPWKVPKADVVLQVKFGIRKKRETWGG